MKTYLTCGSCGNASWYGEQDPQHDTGYGTCVACDEWIGERETAIWRTQRDRVAASLNETNRAQFLSMDESLQRGIMGEMVEDGILTWQVAP